MARLEAGLLVFLEGPSGRKEWCEVSEQTVDDQQKIDDGGPAFPTTPVSHGYAPTTEGAGTGAQAGMTLRDWFAGMVLSNPAICDGNTNSDSILINCEVAYMHADIMLKARKQ